MKGKRISREHRAIHLNKRPSPAPYMGGIPPGGIPPPAPGNIVASFMKTFMISGSLWYLTMLLGLEEQSITACWILGFWNAIASSGSPMSFEMASCGVMPMAANCSCTSGEFMSGMPSWGEKLPPPAFICFMIPLSWSLYMGLDRSISNVSGLRIISGRYGYIISCIWGLRSMFCMYSRSSGESSPSSPTGSPVTVSAAAASAAKASAKGLGAVEGPASSVASAKKLPEPTAPDSSFFSSFFSSAAVAPAVAVAAAAAALGASFLTSVALTSTAPGVAAGLGGVAPKLGGGNGGNPPAPGAAAPGAPGMPGIPPIPGIPPMPGIPPGIPPGAPPAWLPICFIICCSIMDCMSPFLPPTNSITLPAPTASATPAPTSTHPGVSPPFFWGGGYA
mmetsp:Transcript_2628/g.11892  ORF Transcript_2628/g.11892 Transcript_2628/m.11892 type:complete len:392 (-) Transcript_2628:85-1260(-)